jgi:hypothetical protein
VSRRSCSACRLIRILSCCSVGPPHRNPQRKTRTRGETGVTTAAIIIVNAGLDVVLLCGLAYHMLHARHLRPHTWDQTIAVITKSVGESTPTASHASARQP